MASDERDLATWLSRRDEVALAETLAVRGVSPTAALHDYFDVADALLDAASLDRALTRLPRVALIALADPDASSAARVPPALALADDDGRPYAAVTVRVDLLRQEHPESFVAAAPAPPREVGGEAIAAEHAFSAAGALADALVWCQHAPLARTGAGTVTAADRKRLAEGGAAAVADEIDDLFVAANAAGLARDDPREWVVTDLGEQWLQTSTPDRWRIVVAGLLRALPDGVRTGSGGVADPSTWQGAYPLDTEWGVRADRLARIAVRWGLLGADGSEPEWTARVRAGGDVDASGLAALLPSEIDRVYLQADLTAIAPGPLAPALDLRLRSIAARESRAQASTYRFTAASLGAGMTEGETAGSIREFLSQLSLTGIPQPLEYLIDSTATRHGLIRVGADEASGRTRVVVLDPALAGALVIDQALRPIGLVRDGDTLYSRVSRDAVYWSLADARYPVVAVDASGAPESIHRRGTTATVPPAPEPRETYASLLATLRDTHGTDGDAAWLGRELEQAVRAKAEIEVDVRLPDGTERTFTLEASGLGGGRLRGRDRAADVERTLPVSSIVSVRAV